MATEAKARNQQESAAGRREGGGMGGSGRVAASRRGRRRLLSIMLAFSAALLVQVAAPRAETVDPAVARGKSVLYVYNRTKLEKARATAPADPKRIAQIET